ncbi:hypothetical protein [Nocardioides lianchengensis]|uniref:Uncharacterized protein n=1 Tax=Nocardioides lianchengensis TaxID=1045774 RepID=A0A1G6XUE8_9ACTN|nr:hypothetical protein [Nocardioides lianchengensis]NYG13445.1 hypothetical protein [Nocardioides lianchengensis]SDD81809.1 hypothetical protein SAMN05421872_11192 [Nocardioides lianchengensis]
MTFLGCGYRVVVPVPGAAGYAEEQARQVLDRFGIPWSPWPALPGGPVEVTGGASYDAGRRAFGPTVVDVTPLDPAPASGPLRAVDLPWWWSSDGPLAGLPDISALEATVAERHLGPGTVGLWWNHRDELCTSTAGPLLLRLADGWVHPDDAAGAVPSWAWAQEAAARAARPVRVDRALLAAAAEVLAVSPRGESAEVVGRVSTSSADSARNKG